ncbi:MAG: M48 family metalloprotease [Myxococcaceae bacterium]
MEPLYSASELAQVHAYHAPRYIWAYVAPASYLLLLLAFMAWAAHPLYALCQRAGQRLRSRILERVWGGADWSGALLYALTFFILFELTYLPFTLYFGFFQERAHGLWTASFSRFAWEHTKTLVLQSLGQACLVFGVFGLARRTPRWWLVLGVPAALLLMMASVLDPYRARLHVGQHPLEPGPLRGQLERVLAQAKVPFRDIHVEKSSELVSRPEAYFAGQGATRVIILNDVLLGHLTPAEVEAVVAHESGHVHQPRWLGRIGAGLGLLLVLYCVKRLLEFAAQRAWLGMTSPADARALPLLLLMQFVVGLAMEPVSSFLSRKREAEADRFALALTQDAQTYEAMLRKVARLNKADPSPPLWIRWLADHPPMGERLQLAHNWTSEAVRPPTTLP